MKSRPTSLRFRLVVTLGLSFCTLWLAAAAWLYGDLRHQMRDTLDQRLAASARMVAGLVAQLPDDAWRDAGPPVLSLPPSADVACQVRAPEGRVLLRTHGGFAGQLDTQTPGYSNREIDGRQWRLFTYVQDGMRITTADRMGERAALQRQIAVVAAAPFLVALLGSLLAVWWGVRRGLRPLDRLRAELQQRQPGTLAPVALNDAPEELRPAIWTLNDLLERMREAMAREQRFTSNAAHELRTPLTAIKTHLQVAQRLRGDQAEQALKNAEAGIARLQRTLEQLLMLARVEGDQPWPAATHASVGEIVDTAMAHLPEADRVSTDIDKRDAAVAVPRELAVAALRNLLDNALRHTPATAPVELAVRNEPDALLFLVRDRGDWPPDEDPRKLMQRFRRRGDTGGSGLGLAIVAAIAARFGAVEFRNREGGGLTARLALARGPDDPAN